MLGFALQPLYDKEVAVDHPSSFLSANVSLKDPEAIRPRPQFGGLGPSLRVYHFPTTGRSPCWPKEPKQASTVQPSNTPLPLRIQFPLSVCWREHSDLRAASASPIPGYGQVTGGPEWPATAIRGAPVEHSIAIEIQLPFASARCEHPDARDPITSPVSYHWLIGRGPKGAQAGVGGPFVELPVAIEIKEPFPSARSEGSNPCCCHSCFPVSCHWQIIRLPEGSATQVDGAVFPLIVPIAVEFPHLGCRIESPELKCPVSGPIANDRAVRADSEGRRARIDRAAVELPVTIEIKIPGRRAWAEDPNLHLQRTCEGSGTGGGGADGDRAIATIGSAAPAGESGTSSWGGRERDDRVSGIGFRAIRTTVNACPTDRASSRARFGHDE